MPAEVPRTWLTPLRARTTSTVTDGDVALLRSTSVGRGPISDIAVDADTVVVTNFSDNSIAVLDPDTLALHGGVFAGQPTTVAVSEDRAFVAVSSAGYDAVAVIDTNDGDVVREYPLAFNVTALVASSDGKRIYAGRAGDDGVDVAVIDVTAERVGTIYVAKGADATIDALGLDASGRRLFVAVSDARSSRLLTVDVESSRVRRTLEIGAPIRGLQIGMDSTAYVLTSDIADGGVLYFVDLVDNKISGHGAGRRGAHPARAQPGRHPCLRGRLRPGRRRRHRHQRGRRDRLGGRPPLGDRRQPPTASTSPTTTVASRGLRGRRRPRRCCTRSSWPRRRSSRPPFASWRPQASDPGRSAKPVQRH